MNDTIQSKGLVWANVTGTVLDGAAKAFPRSVSTQKNVYARSYTSGNTRLELLLKASPTDSLGWQRSTAVLKGYFTRVDALSQPIRVDESYATFSMARHQNVTLAEMKDTIVRQLLGTLTEGASTSASVIDGQLNNET